MSNEYIITREAIASDLPALTTLMEALGYPCSIDEMSQRFANIRNEKGYKTIVAEYQSRVAGMAGLTRNYFYERNGTYIRIAALVVLPQYRRKHIGQLLIEAACDWAAEIGTETILLNSGDREERRISHIFYEQMGFVKKSIGFEKKCHFRH